MSVNPFDSPGKWYKGNLHTHTNNSDGELSPQEVVNWYRSRGYDFLVISDHNELTDVAEFSHPHFLTINGMEFGVDRTELGETYHFVALNLQKAVELSKGITAQKTMDLIRSEGGEVIVAHPYWSGLTINDLLPLQGHIGLEIFNTTCLTGIGKGLSSVHWDDLLARGKRIWGFAVDDAHFHRSDAGEGWIMVKASKLARHEIISAIKEGCFYSSCGPQLIDVQLSDSTVLVKCSEVAVINFICDLSKGKSIRAGKNSSLTEAEFKLSGKESYVRVECIDEMGRYAWSNPFFLDRSLKELGT